MKTKKIMITLAICAIMIGGATGCTKPASNKVENAVTTTTTAPVDKVNYLQYTETSFAKSLKSAKVTLGEYKTVKFEAATKTLSEEEVTAKIKTDFTKQKEIKTGTVAKGDNLNIDFVGKIDGKEFDGGTAKGQQINIGAGTFIPGFEEGLIGVKVGATKDVKVTFPSTYNTVELRNKAAVFTITVTSKLGESYVPELTDTFINTETKGKYKTYKEYVDFTRSELQKQYDLMNANAKKQSITKKLGETSKVEGLDKTELAAYVANAIKYYKDSSVASGSTYAEYLKSLNVDEAGFTKLVEQEYTSMISNTIVLETIAKQEKIVIVNSDVQTGLNEAFAQYGYKTADEFSAKLISDKMMGDFVNSIKENKTMEFLIKNNTFTAPVVPVVAPVTTPATTPKK